MVYIKVVLGILLLLLGSTGFFVFLSKVYTHTHRAQMDFMEQEQINTRMRLRNEFVDQDNWMEIRRYDGALCFVYAPRGRIEGFQCMT